MRNVLRSIAVASALASPAALAGVSGNVGAVSEYMFRGVPQSAGAAVQGGVDLTTDVGFYAGTWGSNIGFGGGSEVDWYGGYSVKLGPVGLDMGAIYYWYSEEDEVTVKLHTLEAYFGVSAGPVTVKTYYADEANFFGAPGPAGKAREAQYVTAAFAQPLSDTLSFNLNLGYYFGDGVLDFLASIGSTDDKYIDAGIGLSKALDNGLSATFSYIVTDIETTAPTVEDDPKFVIGLKKSFDL